MNIIDKFKSLVWDCHMNLVCKVPGAGLENEFVNATYDSKIDYMFQMINKWINIFVDALI